MPVCLYILRTYPSHCFITAVCFSIKYQPLNDNNSEEFHASFVLELCKPLPAAVEVVHKIYEVLNKGGKKMLLQCTFSSLGKGRAGLTETLGWGIRPASQNPYPI